AQLARLVGRNRHDWADRQPAISRSTYYIGVESVEGIDAAPPRGHFLRRHHFVIVGVKLADDVGAGGQLGRRQLAVLVRVEQLEQGFVDIRGTGAAKTARVIDEQLVGS